MILDKLTEQVIGAGIEVHRVLGPGLLESAYESCLCRELELRGIPFTRQAEVSVEYKGLHLDCGYKIDILVNEQLVLELKAVEKLVGIHMAQTLTYMRLKNIPVGLAINFNVPVLKDGIRRLELKS